MKLYETVDALAVIREWMDEHDDEIRANEGALPDELADLLSQAEGDFKTKVQRIALFIRELEHYGKIAKAEKDRFADRQKSFESRVDRLKNFYLKSQLAAAQEPRVECELLTVRIQKNGAPAVEHTKTPEALYNMECPYASKVITTVYRPGCEPVAETNYNVSNSAIVDDYKSKMLTDDKLVEYGISIVHGTHVRIQ